MSLVLFPEQLTVSEIPEESWTSIQDVWINAIDWFLLGESDIDASNLVEFVESYVHHVNINNSSKELRQRVFSLIKLHPQIFRSCTPEFVYQVLIVFGSSNVGAVISFIESRPGLSLLVKKLAKIFIHKASNDLDQVEPCMAVFLTSNKLCKMLATDKYWIENSPRYPSLDILTHRGIAVAQLQHMFPDISLKRIAKVLDQYISVEEASQHLIDHPDDAEQSTSTIKESVPVVEKAPQLHPEGLIIRSSERPENLSDSAVDSIMRLVERQMEEDEEDELEETQRGEDPQSAKNLDKVERHLWHEYQRRPDVFSRDNRRSKARMELRNATKWTDEQIEGWAKMLERNPRRKLFYETRFMFRGNKAHDTLNEETDDKPANKHSTDSTRNSSRENTPAIAQSNSASSSTNSNIKPKSASQTRRKNHHRKDRHDKKMAFMGAT